MKATRLKLNLPFPPSSEWERDTGTIGTVFPDTPKAVLQEPRPELYPCVEPVTYYTEIPLPN